MGKMKTGMILLLLGALLSPNCASRARYDNYKVYRVTPRSFMQLKTLRDFEVNSHGFDFWSDVSKVGQPVDVMVAPHLQNDFTDFLMRFNLGGYVWIEDVQKLIDDENAREEDDLNWKKYQTLEKIYAWLDTLAKTHPNIVTPIVAGESFEGRQTRGVKLSFGAGRKGAFIEGGIHAREWIAPAVVTYVLNEFLTSKNRSIRAVAESRDWYFVPSINPDGYVYSVLTDRLWRKNRKPYSVCIGVDLNRNWNYHWMEGGASSDECSTTFAGNSPFSEIETRSVSQYIRSIGDTLDAYLAFHSYSQLLLIPFGHTGLEVPENNDELHRIGWAAAKSLAVRYGTNYTVGNWPETLYASGGVSVDWALGNHRNIRLAYTYELRDKGKHGFLLPPEQIIPTAEETLDSLVRIFTEVNRS